MLFLRSWQWKSLLGTKDIWSGYGKKPMEHDSEQPIASPQWSHIQGIVERITYHTEDSGYSVVRLSVAGERELVTVLGHFAAVEAGQTLRCTGSWKTHPKYGEQFVAVSSQELKPATVLGIERYLGSGLIKGIGPKTAARIVRHFGLATLDVIEQTPERLLDVHGLGQQRVARISAAWEAQKVIKDIMLFLQSHQVSPAMSAKIYKTYGQEAIAIVSENPYRLASDIYGIGFTTADTIARNVGIAPESDFRVRADIASVLDQAGEDGHCYLPRPELVEQAITRLALPDHPILPAQVERLIAAMMAAEEPELIQEQSEDEVLRCFAPPFSHAERGLANCIRCMPISLVCSAGLIANAMCKFF